MVEGKIKVGDKLEFVVYGTFSKQVLRKKTAGSAGEEVIGELVVGVGAKNDVKGEIFLRQVYDTKGNQVFVDVSSDGNYNVIQEKFGVMDALEVPREEFIYFK